MKKYLLFILSLMLLFSLFSFVGCNGIKPIHPHQYALHVNNATCTEAGSVIYTCDCGETKTEEIPALGHSVVVDNAVEPTCTQTGLTEGSHCSRCGETLVEQEIIPALNHAVVTDSRVEPTCTETGLTEGSHCSRCGDTLVEQEVVPELGHIVIIEEKVEPTYWIDGLTEGSHCSRCGDTLVEQEIIPAIFGEPSKYQVAPRIGNSIYGFNSFASYDKGKEMQVLYYQFYSACEAFMDSTATLESPVICAIDTDNFTLTLGEIVSVWKIFYLENPAYYWLANTFAMADGQIALRIDESYLNAAYRAECDAAIESLVNGYRAVFEPGYTQLETALAIHDYIIGVMDYAYEEDGVTSQDDIWAHNMAGCALYREGVCESYAKTYLYLSLLSGLDCVIVSGQANNEEHAWNIIQIDGIWYGVDCTWDDVGNGAFIYDWFGMASEYLDSTHFADSNASFGVDYLYELPQVSARNVELVSLYKSDAYVGIFANVDLAFEAMTDSTADYRIELFEYAFNGTLLPNVIHGVQSEIMPSVASIHIKGHNFILDEHSNLSTTTADTPLKIAESVTANSNIVIEDVTLGLGNYVLVEGFIVGTQTFVGGNLFLKDYCLTIQGSSCIVNANIISNINEGATSKIINKAGVKYISSLVNVHDFISDEYGDTTLRNSSKIVNLVGECRLYLWAEQIIEINNWKDIRHSYIKCKSNCKIIINNITEEDVDLDNRSLHIDFSKYEEYPEIIIGDIQGGIMQLSLADKRNIIGSHTKSIDIFGLDSSLITLINKELTDFIKIRIANTSITLNPYTYIDEFGDVYFKEVQRINDLIIIDNTVVRYDNKDITSAVIPDGVVAIGDYAFSGCSNLTELVIPNSVTRIGTIAFYNCTNLVNVFIPGSVKTIGTSPFLACDNLTNVILGEGVTVIWEDVFNFSTSLVSIEIPNSVISIEKGAFYYCTSLNSIKIPDSVTSIGDRAFSGCSSLTEIVIPDSVTSIGVEAFAGCGNLQFYTEGNLKYLGNNSNPYLYLFGSISTDITTVKINENCKIVGDRAFYDCRSLTEIEIPDSVTSIGDHAFHFCSSLTEIVIPDSVTSIGDSTFVFCSSLTEIVIPDSVTSIGDRAFYYCSSLTEIVIPDGVTSIGSSAFSGCSSLTEITVSEKNANYKDIDGNLYSKDGKALVQYAEGKNETTFSIPDSVTSIGAYAFDNCRSLTEIEIPDSVTSIGDHAFSSCSSLTEVVIPDSVISIGDNAFEHCSSLTGIVIPDSVTSIGHAAFWCCSSLTSIVIPDSVTSIGEKAFVLCGSLTEITVSEKNANYKDIDGNLYSKDGKALVQYAEGKNETTFSIPDSVTSIGDGAFEYCSSLTSIVIPDSVTSIGNYAFFDCSSLSEIVIPESVTSVGNNAFSSCDSLTNVYYKGSVAEWLQITIEFGNEDLTEETIYYYSEQAPTEEGNFWYYDENGDIAVWG